VATAALALAGCSAETEPADNVGSTTATLHSHLTWKSSEHGSVWWEYSRDGSGTWTQFGGGAWGDPNSSCDGSGSTSSYDWSGSLTGLTPNTDYIYRIAGQACASGTAYEDSTGLSGDDTPYEYDFFRTKPAACTQTVSPGANLQSLVNSLSPGQVGCLHGGTYTMSEVDITGDGITLTSYPGERATIKGTLKVVAGADGAVLMHLNLNGAGGAMGGQGPNLFGNDAVLYGNDITNDHTGICVVVGGYQGPVAYNTKIEANKIHDCGVLPAQNHDHGIYAEYSDGMLVRGNWIYDNADRGVQLRLATTTNSEVYGNVIDGNGEGVIYAEGTSGNVVRNNVIAHSTIRWNVEQFDAIGPGNVLRDNCVYATNSNSYYNSNGGVNVPDVTKQNNLTSAPQFVAWGSKDFRLQSGSPCASRYADVFDGTAP
jgi:parallel beta-helix repeat protein